MLSLIEIRSILDMDEATKKRHLLELFDKENLKFSRQRDVEHTIDSVEMFIRQTWELGGKFYLIFSKGNVIGTLTLNRVTNRLQSIGILMYRNHHNSGNASSAIDYAIRTIDAKECKAISIGTHVANFPMRRVLEKLKFVIDCSNNSLDEINNLYFIRELG